MQDQWMHAHNTESHTHLHIMYVQLELCNILILKNHNTINYGRDPSKESTETRDMITA